MTHLKESAKTLLKSWLSAVSIDHWNGSESDLVVRASNGTVVPVRIVIDGPFPEAGEVAVDARSFTGGKLEPILGEFSQLQKRLGYPEESPVGRGVCDKRLANGSEPELTAFRHREFRKAPNPAKGVLEGYLPVVMSAVRKFRSTNADFCADQMLEAGDLKSYGLVWTTTFVALYAQDGGVTNDNNKFLLLTYLKQRFAELRTMLQVKGRSVLPMLDDAFIGTHGEAYDYGDKSCWEQSSEKDEIEKFVEFVGVVDPIESYEEGADEEGPEERRRAAKRALQAKLGKMGTDEFVKIMTAAATNDRIHPDARKLAARHLSKVVAASEDEIEESEED